MQCSGQDIEFGDKTSGIQREKEAKEYMRAFNRRSSHQPIARAALKLSVVAHSPAEDEDFFKDVIDKLSSPSLSCFSLRRAHHVVTTDKAPVRRVALWFGMSGPCDEMAEKRKLRAPPTTRTRKSDATTPQRQVPAKRKASATPAPKLPEAVEEEPLPTKIKEGNPLPTLAKVQPGNLSLRDYQPYDESAVVVAALRRSQTRWLHECIFEKYWTKPSRKKGQPQPATPNPPKESMTKLGPCTIVIEPHHFDVMLYTVRNPQSQQQTPHPPPPPSQKPLIHVQYTAPSNSNTFHQYQPPPPANQSRQSPQVPQNSHMPALHSPQVSQPAPKTTFAPPSQPIQPAQQSAGQTYQSNHFGPLSSSPSETPSRPLTSHGESQPSPPPQKPPDPPPQPPKGSADPVIQMLATRAAVNPELKALMRVVASSEASQEQLRAFQAHIDELNAIIASRNQQESRINSPQTNSPYHPKSTSMSPVPPGPSGPPAASRPGAKPLIFQPQSHHPPPTQYYSPSNHQPSCSSPSTPPIRSKFPQQPPPKTYLHQQRPPPQLQPARQDIKAVVFEFITPPGPGLAASGDRYLLPENMIIDYIPPGTQVIASFLVVKKVGPNGTPLDTPSSTNTKSKAKKTKITSTPDGTPKAGTPSNAMTQAPLPQKTAHNARVLEPLARAVKPLVEVQRYMNDVMDRVERAPIRYLAMRLPCENPGKNGTDDSDTVQASAGDPSSRTGNTTIGNKTKDRSEMGAAVKEGTENRETEATPSLGEDNEELKDFYDAPFGLVPLR
ncbi:hypothetical protein CISG_08190 [Coccidioides immitis RMSCC 3703]|uniref:SWR1-complex protein 3 domain-containing protein n=1 Tax=Coccidioides immitis RMSCC 3703 TaxID=454286 RepID=A0A0J8R826_COCIT|nr:hypothetical protein CISG_08190 [Coccidioides immitis RMSCC 3703]